MNRYNLYYTRKPWSNAVGHITSHLIREGSPFFYGASPHDGDINYYPDIGIAATATIAGVMGVHALDDAVSSRSREAVCNLAKQHSAVITLTHWAADIIRKHNPHVAVIPAGVAPAFKPLPRTRGKNPVVGVVGINRTGTLDVKGDALLAQVIAQSKGLDFLVVGNGWHNSAAASKNAHVSASFRLAGYEEMPLLYNKMDILLCTSRAEGGHLPTLEALACGVPVISTKTGYARDIDQEMCRTADSTPADMLREINSVLSAGYPQEAVSGIASTYTWDAYFGAHLEAFRQWEDEFVLKGRNL